MMGSGEWIIGLLAKIPLMWKLINGKLLLNINIPLFHHSIMSAMVAPDGLKTPH
jgi:hypothetical protein